MGITGRAAPRRVGHVVRRPKERNGISFAVVFVRLSSRMLGGRRPQPALPRRIVSQCKDEIDPQTSESSSPDGSKIAFQGAPKANSAKGSDIYLIKADGSGERNLTHDAAIDLEPAWSPDGHWIAFASNHDSPAGIYVMKPDGSDVRRVTHVSAEFKDPAWSPDGKRLAFASTLGNGPHGVTDIFVINRDGSNLRRLTRHAGNNEAPVWQPLPRRG